MHTYIVKDKIMKNIQNISNGTLIYSKIFYEERQRRIQIFFKKVIFFIIFYITLYF